MPNRYLDDSFVFRSACQVGKDQVTYWDHPVADDGRIRNGSVNGLGLRVTAAGRKAFIHDYLLNGRRYRKVIGSTVSMNVGEARLLVIRRQQELDAGADPDRDRIDPRRKHFMTVREAIDGYWEGHVKGLSEEYKASFGRYVAKWLRPAPLVETRRGKNKRKTYIDFGTMFAECALASIKPLDIERYQKQFAAPHSFNSALTRVSALFNWAIRMQLVDIRNPCTPIRPRKIIRQRRDYSTEQIRIIAAHIFNPPFEVLPDIEGLEGREKRNRALVKARMIIANDQMAELCRLMGILFLTMARPSDLATARFDHFELDRLIWHKHNTKGIKLSRAAYEYAYRSVPIHPKVSELVRAQRARWPASELLFPSHTDPTQPRDNFRKGLERFKALPGVPDYFQLYDLKRIAISLMLTGQGVSHEAISHYVDHKGNLETTMIYDLGLVDPLRPVTERLGHLLGI